MFGMVNFAAVGKASWVTGLQTLPYGFEFNLGAVIGVTIVSIVSAVETIGDTSATAKAGAGREATDEEISGATYADGSERLSQEFLAVCLTLLSVRMWASWV